MSSIRPKELDTKFPPEDIVFDNEYSESNPLTGDDEYDALKLSILKVGQQTPIIRYKNTEGNWVCGDGRHRVRACKELGIEVLVSDIPEEADESQIALIMLATENSRNVTDTQKAIKAHRRIEASNLVIKEVCELIGIKRQLVSYVNTIVKYETNKDYILEELFQGRKVNVGEINKPKWSESLEVVAKYSKARYEAARLKEQDNRVQWKADGFIKTEAGKKWYYDRLRALGVSNDDVGIRMDYVELANYKFEVHDES